MRHPHGYECNQTVFPGIDNHITAGLGKLPACGVEGNIFPFLLIPGNLESDILRKYRRFLNLAADSEMITMIIIDIKKRMCQNTVGKRIPVFALFSQQIPTL